MTICTVVVTAQGTTCGEPVTTTFTGRNGETFGECVTHEVHVTHETAPVKKAKAVRCAACNHFHTFSICRSHNCACVSF